MRIHLLKTPNHCDDDELGIKWAPSLNISIAFNNSFFQIIIACSDTRYFQEALYILVGCHLQFCIRTKIYKCHHLHRGDEQFWRIFNAVTL